MAPRILIRNEGNSQKESSTSEDEENDIELTRRILIEYAKYDKKYLDNISDLSPLKFKSISN